MLSNLLLTLKERAVMVAISVHFYKFNTQETVLHVSAYFIFEVSEVVLPKQINRMILHH